MFAYSLTVALDMLLLIMVTVVMMPTTTSRIMMVDYNTFFDFKIDFMVLPLDLGVFFS